MAQRSHFAPLPAIARHPREKRVEVQVLSSLGFCLQRVSFTRHRTATERLSDHVRYARRGGGGGVASRDDLHESFTGAPALPGALPDGRDAGTRRRGEGQGESGERELGAGGAELTTD